MLPMFSSRASAQAISGPAPPNASNVACRGSTPWSMVISRMVLAIEAVTMVMTPCAA